MKRVMYALVVAVGCTVTAAAQSGMGADKMAKDKMAKDAPKTVTVSGCVAEADGHYMLNNATMADMAGAPMSYQLTGGTLKPHIGHKVEVTGMMKPMAKEKMGKESMAKAPMAKEGMKKDAMAMNGTLAVTSLKMVAPTCQ
jgi:tRNA A37 methylthiotransferase MiaB